MAEVYCAWLSALCAPLLSSPFCRLVRGFFLSVAVIVALQRSMLAVDRAVPHPLMVEGQLVIRTTLKLCLSVDHRVMDGGPAVEFLGCIVAALEKPELLT